MFCVNNYVFCSIHVNNPDTDKIIKPYSVNIDINNITKIPSYKDNELTILFSQKACDENITSQIICGPHQKWEYFIMSIHWDQES